MKKILFALVSTTLLLNSCGSGPSGDTPPSDQPLESYKGTWEWGVIDSDKKFIDKGVAILSEDENTEDFKGTVGVFSSEKIKTGISAIGRSKKLDGQPLTAVFTKSVSKDADLYIRVQDANNKIEEQDGKPVFAGILKSGDNKEFVFVAIRVSQKTKPSHLNLMDKIDLNQMNLDQQVLRD